MALFWQLVQLFWHYYYYYYYNVLLIISTLFWQLEYFNISDSWMYMIIRPCLLPFILRLSGPSSLVSKNQCRF